MTPPRKLLALAALMLTLSTAYAADLEVRDAWARGTVPGQKSSGAFMTLVSPVDATLVSASSPLAGSVEVHEMKMDGNVMKMRAVPKLALPAGKPVELSGDYHVMLMGLKQTLNKGDEVPLTLKLKNAKGKTETVKIKVPVRDLAGNADEHSHH